MLTNFKFKIEKILKYLTEMKTFKINWISELKK